MAKRWRKENQSVSNSTYGGDRITINPVPGSLSTVPGSLSNASPTNDEAATGGLKPSEVFKETTTDDVLRIPIPSSSSLKRMPSNPTRAAATPIQEFHQRLYRTFHSAGKPTPLLSQSETALAALGDDWQPFLEWLPTAPQFEACRTPGGLPTLIQFFREKPVTKETPELPAPCPKCRELGGRILVEHKAKKGIFAGKKYTTITECDCALGRVLRKGRERFKAESPRQNEYRGYPEPEGKPDAQ